MTVFAMIVLTAKDLLNKLNILKHNLFETNGYQEIEKELQQQQQQQQQQQHSQHNRQQQSIR